MTRGEDDPNLDVDPSVEQLVSQASRWIHGAFGVEPDLTVETLPLADAYIRSVVATLPSEERERQLDAIGVYFGEVARRKLAGRWGMPRGGPSVWRIELTSCFLYFNPVGMAGETLVGCETDVYDGTFATRDDIHDDLERALRQAPPISEEEYFSLSGRMEILALVADFLVSRALVNADGDPPPTYAAADYRALLDEDDG